ncbi:MAG: hypothetical protein IBJ11_04090 [Phycisphaerales bacterium]|nr:hypothetical protein [Phycisphaerales bacterium]
MNWIVFILAAYGAFALEFGVRDALQLGHTAVAPHFVLVLLAFVGVWAPSTVVLWASLALGLGLDLFYAFPSASGGEEVVVVGPWALGCLAAGYTVLTMRPLMFRRGVMALGFLALCGSAVCAVVCVTLLTLRARFDASFTIDPAWSELGVRLANAVYTWALALALAVPLRAVKPVFGFPATGSGVFRAEGVRSGAYSKRG